MIEFIIEFLRWLLKPKNIILILPAILLAIVAILFGVTTGSVLAPLIYPLF